MYQWSSPFFNLDNQLPPDTIWIQAFIPPLKTNIQYPLNIDGWKMKFSFEMVVIHVTCWFSTGVNPISFWNNFPKSPISYLVKVPGSWDQRLRSVGEILPISPVYKVGEITHLTIHPWKLTWNPKMEFWKMISLFKQVIFRFHVNFPGCNHWSIHFRPGNIQVYPLQMSSPQGPA